MGYIGNAPYQGVVTGGNIQDGTVDTADIANDAVTTVKINDLSVTEGKINNGAVTNNKIATGVDASKLTTGTLPIARIADASITAAKLAAGAAVPVQTGNSGKFLTTDGTNASWGTVATPTPAAVSDQANTSTGAFDVPSGTTAQRPASPTTGNVRYNTSLEVYEVYNGAAWASLAVMLDGSTAALAPVSAAALISAGKGSNGLYYIKPDNGTATQMYCWLSTFGPWVTIGRSASAINTYTNAPGFYNSGASPTPSQNGSISLFDWSDSYVNNNTLFRFYDTQYGNWVEFYVANLTSIKASPNTYIPSDDAFQIRFTQQSASWNTSSTLNQFCRIASYQGLSNVPGFGVGSATSPIGYYGKTLYYATTSESDKRGFLFANGSGYEGAYGSAGLQRYNPTPYYAGGNILLLMKV